MLKFPLLEVGEVDKAMEQGQETLSVLCSATEDIGFLHLEEGKQGGREAVQVCLCCVQAARETPGLRLPPQLSSTC